MIPIFDVFYAMLWSYDEVIDPAIYAWRMRWFEPENNPFGAT